MRLARIPILLLVISLVAVGVGGGCETEFQKKLAKRKAFAESEVFVAFDRLLSERQKKAGRALPEDMSERRDGRSMAVAWRAEVAAMDTVEQLEGLLAQLGTGQSPEAEKKIREALALLRGERDYWVEKKRLKAYEKFLTEFTSFHKEGMLAEEAAFERIYIHVAHLFERDKYDDDTKQTSMFRYWKLAFDFPSEKREKFMDYITRLCNKRLGAYCAEVMWEHRAESMEKPYLLALNEKIAAFKRAYPSSMYLPVLARLEREFGTRAGAVGPFEVYPNMAEMTSARYCVGNSLLEIGPRGVSFEGELMGEPAEGYKRSAKDQKAIDKKLEEILWEAIDRIGGTDPYIPLITIMANEDVPFSLVSHYGALFAQNRVDQVAVCGRKRNDGTNRKAMHLFTLFPQKNKRKKEVLLDADGKIDKITEVEKMDSEKFRAALPKKPMAKDVSWLGFLGRLGVDIPSPTAVYRLTDEGWLVAPINEKGKVSKAVPVKALSKEQKAQAAAVIVSKSLTLQGLFQALDGAMLNCAEPDCKKATYLDTPVAFGVYP